MKSIRNTKEMNSTISVVLIGITKKLVESKKQLSTSFLRFYGEFDDQHRFMLEFFKITFQLDILDYVEIFQSQNT